jgi:phenylacetate-coenzyme A ligase PaaK-like adenylate-forming protein
MQFSNQFKNSLFETNFRNFNEKALELFRFQAQNNEIYKKYLAQLRFDPLQAQTIYQIPFLPIEFYKFHRIISGPEWKEETYFESSGTTGQVRSRHFVKDLKFYKSVAEQIFTSFYGGIEQFVFIAFLPSYRENPHSSLIWMIDDFILKSGDKNSVYVNEHQKVEEAVNKALKTGKKVILWGVSYALLDLAENFPQDLSRIMVMETGGMKGRGREMTREELHDILKRNLNLSEIHSEYGMTELLSQGYATKNGLFRTPDWLKVFTRELLDPFSISNYSKTGGINVIDLANVDSCAFIETKDFGIVYEDGSFEIKGRIDNSDIRGCNLLYTL